MSKLSDYKAIKPEKEVTQADLKEKYDEYKDMSQEQLSSTLFSEVARQKKQGTFDYVSLERMVDSLRGSLPENEFQNIKRLLESLR